MGEPNWPNLPQMPPTQLLPKRRGQLAPTYAFARHLAIGVAIDIYWVGVQEPITSAAIVPSWSMVKSPRTHRIPSTSRFGRELREQRRSRRLICIVPIFVVTAVLFANEIATSRWDFFDFGVVAMAKIREPPITEAIHISPMHTGISQRVLQSRDYHA